jgi:phosphoribosyl 1,2-cyclic phosphodiesterase
MQLDKPELIELVFLGTGTSGRVPDIACLTRKLCKTCTFALTPEGRKNRRRNTSLLARWRLPNNSIL